MVVVLVSVALGAAGGYWVGSRGVRGAAHALWRREMRDILEAQERTREEILRAVRRW